MTRRLPPTPPQRSVPGWKGVWTPPSTEDPCGYTRGPSTTTVPGRVSTTDTGKSRVVTPSVCSGTPNTAIPCRRTYVPTRYGCTVRRGSSFPESRPPKLRPPIGSGVTHGSGGVDGVPVSGCKHGFSGTPRTIRRRRLSRPTRPGTLKRKGRRGWGRCVWVTHDGSGTSVVPEG